jgi:hypothetical protein
MALDVSPNGQGYLRFSFKIHPEMGRMKGPAQIGVKISFKGVIAESVPKRTLRAGMIPRLDFAVER